MKKEQKQMKIGETHSEIPLRLVEHIEHLYGHFEIGLISGEKLFFQDTVSIIPHNSVQDPEYVLKIS